MSFNSGYTSNAPFTQNTPLASFPHFQQPNPHLQSRGTDAELQNLHEPISRIDPSKKRPPSPRALFRLTTTYLGEEKPPPAIRRPEADPPLPPPPPHAAAAAAAAMSLTATCSKSSGPGSLAPKLCAASRQARVESRAGVPGELNDRSHNTHVYTQKDAAHKQVVQKVREGGEERGVGTTGGFEREGEDCIKFVCLLHYCCRVQQQRLVRRSRILLSEDEWDWFEYRYCKACMGRAATVDMHPPLHTADTQIKWSGMVAYVHPAEYLLPTRHGCMVCSTSGCILTHTPNSGETECFRV